MKGFKIALAGTILAALGGCASSGTSQGIVRGASYLECVPYVRANSMVQLYGDAYLWWDKAAGIYDRGGAPKPGSVLTLTGYAGPKRGHLAVVRAVVSSREIRVNHANWLNDGAVHLDNPVQDVSDRNDWTQVRVWNFRTGSWGARLYPVQGFIGPQVIAPSLLSRLHEGIATLGG